MSHNARIRLRRTCPAVADSVGELRRAARRFAAEHGASDGLQRDVALAVSEAATRAVVYGQGAVPGEMTLEAEAEPGRLAIRVRDHTRGLPGPAVAGRGLGLRVIAELAESVEIRSAHGTCVSMSFPLGTPGR